MCAELESLRGEKSKLHRELKTNKDEAAQLRDKVGGCTSPKISCLAVKFELK